MEQQELIPHLFRAEFSKITTVLCKYFGIKYIQVAEDIAGDTFLLAIETWSYQGIPANPTAWLYSVAKNKAKNYMHRNHLFTEVIANQIKDISSQTEEIEIDLSQKNITDCQLQMLFAICHPSISIESQIGLSLRILCGFGIDEIANGFLTTKETITKRLFRAKEKLRLKKIQIEFQSQTEIHKRLKTVLKTLYLLYNEGYYSESQDVILRKDLCLEAMRLTYLLIENETTNLPSVNALYALMCFHSSRFDARKNENGELVLYQDQDETLWNHELILKGMYYLSNASTGEKISKYHLEASIAYWMTVKNDIPKKWGNVLQLYNQLLILEYSSIAALNRAFVFSKVYGSAAGIKETEKLNLHDNHFYYTLLGELYIETDKQKAIQCFHKAISIAKTLADKQTIQKKIDKLYL
jgi:predicted RNA polymerase sigma factor